MLWLGTDIGIFKRPIDLSSDWSVVGGGGVGAGGLPNVPIHELSIDEDNGRIFAATHGRGVWVLTKPFVSTMEGWFNGVISDIPVYGSGFVAQGGQTCTMTIFNQDGSVCGMGTSDVLGGTILVNPETGFLSTNQQLISQGRDLVWACYGGICLGNTKIATCSPSTIKVDCTGNASGIGGVSGAVAQGNPPSGTIDLGDPPPGALDPAFGVAATIQSNDGSTRQLCSVSVSFQAGTGNDAMLTGVASAINASAECISQGVTAVFTPSLAPNGEDSDAPPSRLSLSAPGLAGTELVPAVITGPGTANGTCFHLDNMGVISTQSLVPTRLTFVTAPQGAAGGQISLQEVSSVGSCAITVSTTAGETGDAIAAALFGQLTTEGVPGPANCLAKLNAADARINGATLVLPAARGIVACINDAGVGLSGGPTEIPKLETPPIVSCADRTVSVDDHCQACASVEISAFDVDGDPVSCSQSPSCPFGLGSTPETIVCSDPTGRSASCTANIIAVDTTGPRVTISSDANGFSGTLWPPDHRYHQFDLRSCIASVVDNCDGSLPVDQVSKIVRVTSNEAESGGGSGATCNDIVVTSNTTVFLRAERDGTGQGRVYTVDFAVHDSAGNESLGVCKVQVPHDQAGKPAVDGPPAFCVGSGCGSIPGPNPACQ